MTQPTNSMPARPRAERSAVPMGTLTARHGAWSWSDTVYAIHGFEPGDVVPTAAVMLSHCHPGDRAGLSTLLNMVGHRSEATCEAAQYRLIDAVGREHWVALSLEFLPGEELARGTLLDLTDRYTTSSALVVNAMLATALESRSIIDQAKGVVRLVYGTDDATAFALLKSYSQQTNVKLRTIAETIVESLGRAHALPPAVRRALDDAFLVLGASGHDRAGRSAEVVAPAPGGAARPHAPEAPGDVELAVHVEADAVMVVVVGDLDASAAPAFAATLRAASEQVRPQRPLVIDLTGCVHVGPEALTGLAATQRRLTTSGGTIHALIGDQMPEPRVIAAVVDTAIVPSHIPAGVEPVAPRASTVLRGGSTRRPDRSER